MGEKNVNKEVQGFKKIEKELWHLLDKRLIYMD